MRSYRTARAVAGDKDNQSVGGGGEERRTKREESRARKEQTTGTPFSFVRRGEIETANRVGVDEGEGREEAGA